MRENARLRGARCRAQGGHQASLTYRSARLALVRGAVLRGSVDSQCVESRLHHRPSQGLPNLPPPLPPPRTPEREAVSPQDGPHPIRSMQFLDEAERAAPMTSRAADGYDSTTHLPPPALSSCCVQEPIAHGQGSQYVFFEGVMPSQFDEEQGTERVDDLGDASTRWVQ
jgi:hypothetical protein